MGTEKRAGLWRAWGSSPSRTPYAGRLAGLRAMVGLEPGPWLWGLGSTKELQS